MTIVHEDMRLWQPECKADIMVSELLGSFSDNELSPECLDGAQRYLKGSNKEIFCHVWYLYLSHSNRKWHQYSIFLHILHLPCSVTSYLF